MEPVVSGRSLRGAMAAQTNTEVRVLQTHSGVRDMFSVLCQVADDAGGGGVNRVRKKKRNERIISLLPCVHILASPCLAANFGGRGRH